MFEKISDFIKSPFVLSLAAVSSILGFIISIITLGDAIENGSANTIQNSIYICIGMLACIWVLWWWRTGGVRFYKSWSQWSWYCHKNKCEIVLKQLSKKPHRLDIVARNGFRWLCGSEKLFDSNTPEDRQQFKKIRAELQDLLVQAIGSGSEIHFIIQLPDITIPGFSRDKSERLKRHCLAAIISFYEVKDKLSSEDKKQKFTLTFTNKIIASSIALHKDLSGKCISLIHDIDCLFPHESSNIKKPFLLFSKRGCQSYKDYLEFCEEKIKELEDGKVYPKFTSETIEEKVSNYNQHSSLRNDKPENLIRLSAKRFLYDHGYGIDTFVPHCVQLLVCNTCTTQCIMCDHREISHSDDMSVEEIINVLGLIKKAGTNNVIISGGEPLAHPDICDILKNACKCGLNVGLMTNGVMASGESISNDVANTIYKTCKWVQVSIDSFKKSTYKIIRGRDSLGAALETEQQLRDKSVSTEICFTIQKNNFSEISSIPADKPKDAVIRLKLAHSSARSKNSKISLRSFLMEKGELEELKKQLDIIKGEKNINAKYVLDMINNYYDDSGICDGSPLRNRIDYPSGTHACHIIGMIGKVDSDAKVYPCCFLYDDNYGHSQIRSNFCLGSLRSGSKVLPEGNAYKNIWSGNKLKDIREKFPVETSACSRCTRHFYQNEYMSIAYKVFETNPYTAVEYSRKHLSDEFWI